MLLSEWPALHSSFLLYMTFSRRDNYSAATSEWLHTPRSTLARADFYNRDVPLTQSMEARRRKGLESLLTLQHTTEAFEMKLSVERRWTPDCQEWQETEKMSNNREYRKVVDELEGLVVSRLFELSKMNQAGTGM